MANEENLQIEEDNKIPDKSSRKPTEKIVEPHNEAGHPSKNHNQRKNGSAEENKKNANDVIGLDDERGLQRVDGESRITCKWPH